MKNPLEVLRRKEAELQRLQEEVEALRLVGRMLKENLPARAPQPGRGKIIQMPDAPVNLA
jgi:hypothetical protein